MEVMASAAADVKKSTQAAVETPQEKSTYDTQTTPEKQQQS